MILTLTSNNENLGYVIQKNPNTLMDIRKLRLGKLYNKFITPKQYVSYFKDSNDKCSYGDRVFSYLDISRYSSSAIILGMITELFSTPLKKIHELDTVTEHTITVEAVLIPREKQFERIIKMYPNVNVELTHIRNNIYRLEISTTSTLHYLINITALFMLFNTFYSKDYVDNKDGAIVKYLNILNNTNAPYFIRHKFQQTMLNSPKKFEKYYNQLADKSITLLMGNTQEHRYQFISKILYKDIPYLPLLDVGCGSGFYVSRFKKDRPIYAIERDENWRERVGKKYKVPVFKDITEFKYDKPVDVLITEVIEHNTIEEATHILNYILDNVNYRYIVITTPNREFNRYYGINGYREDDHKWEMTKNEFKEYIALLTTDRTTIERVDHIGVGDCVDGVYSTLGCVVRSNREIKNTDIEVLKDRDNDVIKDAIKSYKFNKKLASKEQKHIQHMVNVGIRYLGATIPPASSDRDKMLLETLENGLNHYHKKGVYDLVLQPKYMGSRCQLYLFKDSTKNMAVSRKGFIIRESRVPGIEQLLSDKSKEYKHIMDELDVDHIIIDGELLPWSILGSGLIEHTYLPTYDLVKLEQQKLLECEFDKSLSDMVKIVKEDIAYMANPPETPEQIKAYGYRKHKNNQYVLNEPKFNCKEHLINIEKYKRQLDIYGKDGDIEFKGFDILYASKNGERVEIPWSIDDRFRKVNNDEILVVNKDTELRVVKEWYKRLVSRDLEGCVIKPITPQTNVSPAIKVRNNEYLRLIYGYNYTDRENYEEFVRSKQTGGKVKLAINEAKINDRLLDVELGSDEHYRLLEKFTFKIHGELELDPKL